MLSGEHGLPTATFRILDAGRIEVELYGTGCPLENIARRAGVGPGTLYRHFRTRDYLLGELLPSWDTAVQADAGATTAEDWPDVLDWLVRLTEHAMVYRGLASTIAAAEGDEASPLRAAHAAVLEAISQVLDRARRARVVQGAPVDAREVSRLVTGVATITEQAHLAPDQVRSMLAIILNGLARAQPHR